MVEVPPIFNVPVAPLVNVPAPESAVLTVKVPLFVYVPVTATDGIEKVPPIVLPAPLKVWRPVPELNVPAFEIFPAILKVLVNVPDACVINEPPEALIVKSPDIVIVLIAVPSKINFPVPAITNEGAVQFVLMVIVCPLRIVISAAELVGTNVAVAHELLFEEDSQFPAVFQLPVILDLK